MQFDANCTRCPRLADYLASSKEKFPNYHCKPVAPFGAQDARFLVVGLAPGLHGANATGRPFTGDHAGILLYETLHKFGFASQPVSEQGDGLELHNCRITNAVKCVPPQNKPVGEEIRLCNEFLATELQNLPDNAVLLALGLIAHNAILKALGVKQSAHKFAHGAEHDLGGLTLIDSYHCSRYNTNTRRLTTEMFEAVFARAAHLLDV